MEDLEENTLGSLIESTGISMLSQIDGIPLPPVVKKNLFKSFNSLITALIDVPTAHLEAKARKIRSESAGLDLVISSSSKSVANEFENDRELIDRSVEHFSNKLLKGQKNRENVVKKTLNEIISNPPEYNNALNNNEIDNDWLETFSRVAETKSSEDVQTFLSKILAGEIKQPGSFSQKSIHTLSLLDQETAQYFQNLCNITSDIQLIDGLYSCLITEPFGNAGDNVLTEFGLPYAGLMALQDAGLIRYSTTSWIAITGLVLVGDFRIGTATYNFIPTSALTKEHIKVPMIALTTVGSQLSRVIHKSTNEAYAKKLVAWLTEKFNIELR